MATVSQLRFGVATLFGVPEMRVKAMSQALAASGLRTEGGAGRGAARMTGRDVGLHAIAFAGDISTKNAAEVIDPIDKMTLCRGFWFHRDQLMWERDDLQHGDNVLLTALSDAAGSPAKDFPTPRTFGEFLDTWIEGVFEPHLGRYLNGDAELTIRRPGPSATFVFRNKDNMFELEYGSVEKRDAARPLWEQLLVLRGSLFQRLAEIIR